MAESESRQVQKDHRVRKKTLDEKVAFEDNSRNCVVISPVAIGFKYHSEYCFDAQKKAWQASNLSFLWKYFCLIRCKA